MSCEDIPSTAQHKFSPFWRVQDPFRWEKKEHSRCKSLVRLKPDSSVTNFQLKMVKLELLLSGHFWQVLLLVPKGPWKEWKRDIIGSLLIYTQHQGRFPVSTRKVTNTYICVFILRLQLVLYVVYSNCYSLRLADPELWCLVSNIAAGV